MLFKRALALLLLRQKFSILNEYTIELFSFRTTYSLNKIKGKLSSEDNFFTKA